MSGNDSVSRRTVLKLAGVAASTAVVAGCLGDGDDDDEPNPDDWEDVDEIVLEGTAQEWVGVEPDHINGQSNPTLVLFEGEEYEITWENDDGVPHNLQIHDEGGEILEETENVDDIGDTATVTFEATSDMVTYVCDIHPNEQVGDIQIE